MTEQQCQHRMIAKTTYDDGWICVDEAACHRRFWFDAELRRRLADSEEEVARQYHEAQVAEAKVARVEAAARAVLTADDGMVTYEPCDDCLRSGVVLVTAESDAAMDAALDDLRAALAVGPAEPATSGGAPDVSPLPRDDDAHRGAQHNVPAEVEQVLSDVWSLEGVRRWWTARNTMLRDRIPRDVYREGPEGVQAVIDLANHLADGNW
ncbi:hypothetical protein [Terrabacter terrigena]|uniref:Antitoxin Xre/MbcA/ParS-like toxin-binding domain-containing protein n=1 Tax=Terrabacter terrigena TaxID=574718 RepID=A0ABW3N0Y2_9MICO